MALGLWDREKEKERERERPHIFEASIQRHRLSNLLVTVWLFPWKQYCMIKQCAGCCCLAETWMQCLSGKAGLSLSLSGPLSFLLYSLEKASFISNTHSSLTCKSSSGALDIGSGFSRFLMPGLSPNMAETVWGGEKALMGHVWRTAWVAFALSGVPTANLMPTAAVRLPCINSAGTCSLWLLILRLLLNGLPD